jgi:hypothetical protein
MIMETRTKGKIHALEFGCQAPLKFYEHCAACSRFDSDCGDLDLGRNVLSGKKKIVYDDREPVEGEIHASAFRCAAPLYYFEKSRKSCGHQGRCREEGLLLALLSGKKSLDYSQKTAIEFPHVKKAWAWRAEPESLEEETASESTGG